MRNISAGVVAWFGITNPPEGMFLAAPPVFARLADKTVEGGAA